MPTREVAVVPAEPAVEPREDLHDPRDELFLSEDEAGPEALAEAVESGAVVFDGPAFEDDLGALVPSPDERAADRRKAARKAQRKARKAGRRR